MKATRAIETAARQAGIGGHPTSFRDLSGGCIHRVQEVALSDGSSVVAKSGRWCLGMFQEEATSLRTLADTQTVLVPRPLAVIEDDDTAVLLLEAIEPGPPTDGAWHRLGRELAALHGGGGPPRYGFPIDNHLGTTPQPNGWCDDWVEFNSTHRLGHQLKQATRAGALRGAEATRIERVIANLSSLIPRHPKPALLHGDLWFGNALAAANERIAVIDPACSWGDGWADIAMMKLFGGFPAGCFEAYSATVDDHDELDCRLAVYQLYHVLNHVNLFGRGYVDQAMALSRALGA